ncbi:hypothetical protein FOMA001_g19564 [Fusarium oxysporum f. sp. matthiolae]|nr:hypothetical protein FOMA001_g19564 [Fusarium oxysporum f. sp. matthiolae]
MPQTPKKRGRPRKYDTPEGKAKRDVAAKRARRWLQKASAHDDIRFQIYVPPRREALPTSPLSNTRPILTSSLDNSSDTCVTANRLDALTPSINSTVAEVDHLDDRH